MSAQYTASLNFGSPKQHALPCTPTSSRKFPAHNATPVRNGASRRRSKRTTPTSPANCLQPREDILSFQPALQGCYDVTTPKSHRASPRYGGNLTPKLGNGYRSSPNSLQRTSNRSTPSTSAKSIKPFAGAKYLELPKSDSLPAPPADWLKASEPSSPTTATAVALATSNRFDVRLSPRKLIAAFSAS